MNVQVAFNYRGKHWKRGFNVDAGSTVRQLKEAMVAPSGSEEDVDSIELQRFGQRALDGELILGEAAFDFLLLFPDEGAAKARGDAARAAVVAQQQRQQQQQRTPEEKPREDLRTSAAVAPVSPPPAATAAEAPAVPLTPAQAAAAAASSPAPRSAPRLRQWVVVGGTDRGGILVREGRDLKSAKTPLRLDAGSVVEELALIGDRLQYRLMRGAGPYEGWVSTRITGKELVRPM